MTKCPRVENARTQNSRNLVIDCSLTVESPGYGHFGTCQLDARRLVIDCSLTVESPGYGHFETCQLDARRLVEFDDLLPCFLLRLPPSLLGSRESFTRCQLVIECVQADKLARESDGCTMVVVYSCVSSAY